MRRRHGSGPANRNRRLIATTIEWTSCKHVSHVQIFASTPCATTRETSCSNFSRGRRAVALSEQHAVSVDGFMVPVDHWFMVRHEQSAHSFPAKENDFPLGVDKCALAVSIETYSERVAMSILRTA